MEDLSKEQKIAKVMTLITEAMAVMATIDDKRLGLVDVAEAGLDTDVSPRDIADDELGCAESVSNLIKKVIPDFPVITGTWTLRDKLEKDDRFVRVNVPDSGDIIISPTGSLRNAPFPGHTGIMLGKHEIMANNSTNGKWEINYDLDTWIDTWGDVGFPIYFYRIK